MVKLLKNNMGKSFEITFIKKNGDTRSFSGKCTHLIFMNDLGYINAVTDKGDWKQVDPRKILQIIMDNKTYETL